jgi:hypothetical protein
MFYLYFREKGLGSGGGGTKGDWGANASSLFVKKGPVGVSVPENDPTIIKRARRSSLVFQIV